MKIKTSELTGAALDYAVAMAEGHNVVSRHAFLREHGVTYKAFFEQPDLGAIHKPGMERYLPQFALDPIPPYSSDWTAGGPLLEREIEEFHREPDGSFWAATPKHAARGPTLLIAGMRAFVGDRLGAEVDIPVELMP
jgi:hypothetical protein